MMSLTVLFVTFIARSCFSAPQQLHLHLFAENLDSESFPFDRIELNLRQKDYQPVIEFEGTILSGNTTNIYQKASSGWFYKVGCHYESNFQNGMISGHKTSGNGECDIIFCLDTHENSKLLKEWGLLGDTHMEDEVYNDNEGNYVIQFLSRQWILRDFDHISGKPTKLLLSTDQETTYEKLNIISFESSTNESYHMKWSHNVPNKNSCDKLNSTDTDSITRRRLQKGFPCNTGCCPARNSIYAPYYDRCDFFDHLFFIHDGYETRPCTGTNYFGSGRTYKHRLPSGDGSDIATIFVPTAGNKCIITISGTNDNSDWWNNISPTRRQWVPKKGYSYLVWLGFYIEFGGIGDEVFRVLNDPTRDENACLSRTSIDLVGHSLGGAMVSMLGIKLALNFPNVNILVAAYGSPRPFYASTRPQDIPNFFQYSFITYFHDKSPIINRKIYDPVAFVPANYDYPKSTLIFHLCLEKTGTGGYRYFAQKFRCWDGGVPDVTATMHYYTTYYTFVDLTNLRGC